MSAKALSYNAEKERALLSLDEKYRQKCSKWNFACPEDRLYTRKRSYSDSEAFRRELLTKHLSAELMQSAAVTKYLGDGVKAQVAASGAAKAAKWRKSAFYANKQPMRFLGIVASFSLWWLIPALLVFIYRAVDQERKELVQSHSVAYTSVGSISIDHSYWHPQHDHFAW
ncbi:MAG: hypothetical protein ACREYF_27765 [Gammaproteobacteria bacterium]